MNEITATSALPVTKSGVKNLRWRFVWIVLLLNLFVGMIVALFLQQSREQYSQHTAVTAQNLAQVLEQQVTATVHQIDLTLLSLADTLGSKNSLHRYSDDQFLSLLNGNAERLPEIYSLQVHDGQGNQLAGTGMLPGKQNNIAEREYFRELQRASGSALVVSRPLMGKLSRQWTIVLARRINTAEGGFAGTVSAVLKLESFMQMFNAINVGAHGAVSLRDTQMGIIARYPEPDGLGSTVGIKKISPQLQTLLATGKTTGYYRALAGVDAVERMIAFRKSPDYPLYINVGLAVEDYLQPWYSEVLFGWVVYAVFVLGSVTASYLIYRNWQRKEELVAELSVQEAKFRTIADYTSNLEAWLGPDSVLHWVNPGAQEMTGYPLSHFEQMRDFPLPLVASEDYKTMRQWLNMAMQGSAGSDVEFRMVCKSGQVLWVAMNWRPVFDDSQHFSGVRVSIRDITEKHKTQDLLEQARDDAEAANRAKSDFLAAMSHEIRTPLNSVIGMTSLILDGELTESQRTYAALVQSSAESLRVIINDVLDFSKIEAQKLEIEKVDFNLLVMLNEITSLYVIRANKKGLAFRTDYPDDLPVWVHGDPVRIRQILHNYLSNALKFTDEGEIILHIARETDFVDDMDSSVTPSLDSLRFTVSDTGIGISPGIQQSLFQPFHQADKSTTRKFGGTGLGLAISRQLAELMEGAVGVQSVEGFGSAFWCSLPLPAVTGEIAEPLLPDVPAQDSRPNADIFARKRILLAEDNPTNQMVAVGLLKKLGITDVCVVDDGLQAVDAYQQQTFDLILMDCQMPVLDGYQATQTLRELGCDLPIVAVTANAIKGDRERCLAVGMNDYLSKPVSTEKLAETLALWLAVGEEIQHPGGSHRTPVLAAQPHVETPPVAPVVEPAPPVVAAPVKVEAEPLPPTEASTPADALPIFDRQAALVRMGGDEDLLVMIVDSVLDDLVSLIVELEDAMEANDLETARRHAHSIKGACANVSAEALRETAWQMEQAAKQGDVATLRHLLPQLQAEDERFRAQVGR